MIDLEEKKGHRLEGVVYQIDSNALKIFDNLEKVSEGKHDRIEVEVLTTDGTIKKAVTYICPVKEGHFKPSKEYMDLIVEGAQLNNLSEEHIAHIKSFLR